MKKIYELNIDLPWTEKGTRTSENGEGKGGDGFSYIRGDTFEDSDVSIRLGKTKDLLENGWIREAIPREFYLVKSKGHPTVGFFKKDNAVKELSSRFKGEIIKVVEVFE